MSEEYPTFEVENVKIITEPEISFNGECVLIRPYYKNEFTLKILIKRFWQIESLVTTHPLNLIRKLKKVIRLENLKITTTDAPVMTKLDLSPAYIYVWQTNNYSNIYLIPSADLIIFITQNNNCYCIDYNVTEIISKWSTF